MQLRTSARKKREEEKKNQEKNKEKKGGGLRTRFMVRIKERMIEN